MRKLIAIDNHSPPTIQNDPETKSGEEGHLGTELEEQHSNLMLSKTEVIYQFVGENRADRN